MAKSIRSKSGRKNRAALCAKVFKPVADASIQRIAIRSKLADAADNMTDLNMATPASKSADETMILASVDPKKRGPKMGKVSRKHGKHVARSLNDHGISAKELRF